MQCRNVKHLCTDDLGSKSCSLHMTSCSIDKILHSLGPKMGYALPVRKLPNPIDIVLVYAQRVGVDVVYVYTLCSACV